MPGDEEVRPGVSGPVFDESVLGPSPVTTTVTVMLGIYFVILVPWIPFFTLMGTGMAFDGGNTLDAYVSVATFWAFPIFVAVGYLFRRRKPGLIWLPTIPLIWFFIQLI
jgi:hypothetical protein